MLRDQYERYAKDWQERARTDKDLDSSQCYGIAATYGIVHDDIDWLLQRCGKMFEDTEKELREATLTTTRAFGAPQNFARPESELTPEIGPGVAQMDENTRREYERWIDAT